MEFSYSINGFDTYLRVNKSNNTYSFFYPCNSRTDCHPYIVDLSKGIYFIESWGAMGGYYSKSSVLGGIPGKGAYVSGYLNLFSSKRLYLYIGARGNSNEVSAFNGGGYGGFVDSTFSGSGGGATDIRLINGSDFSSLKSRILVAGGGGGSTFYQKNLRGGDAGSLIGFKGEVNTESPDHIVATGGTQISGGAGGIGYGQTMNGTFGLGGSRPSYGSGGGGGYYGGGAGSVGYDLVSTGGGGSSFVSGYPGCQAPSIQMNESSLIHEDHPNHYSGIIFTNPIIKSGRESFLSLAGQCATGNDSDGFIKITIIEQYDRILPNFYTHDQNPFNMILTLKITILSLLLL